MDALSDVLTFLKPKAAITGSTECYSPWGIEFTGYDYVKFGFMVEGECYLSAKGIKSVLLEEGDAWILIRPVEFIISSDLKVPAVSSVQFFKSPGPKFIIGKKSTKNLRTTVYGGRLDFDQLNAAFILDNLPRIIVLKASEASDTLKSILKALQDETKSMQMGRNFVIESLIQLVFVEALRSMDFDKLKGGSLKGLAHPNLSKVINAIHRDYKKNWSVLDLSKIYGASRSGFAATFKTIVGVSPMDYLMRWRMIQAKEAFVSGDKRVSEIAYSVGYDSVTAFSTAFSKVMGQSPSSFRENYS